jgi:xanthine dehydrogenase accessory factor
MSDADQVLRAAGEWLARGEKICLATIVRKSGSGPREVGAKMAISSEGKVAGTIGGGAAEQKIIEAAGQVIESGKPVMLEFDLSGESTDIDAICGGNISVFMEVFGQPRRLIVIGAGHVGKAIAKVAAEVGFLVTLVDDREEFLRDVARAQSVSTVTATPEDLKSKLKIDSSSFIVICTRGHSLDRDWLGVVAAVRPRYVGMLGSRHKATRIFDELRGRGISQQLLEKVHSPMGIEIEAVTPEEIAVSVVGQLILEWRKGRPDQA